MINNNDLSVISFLRVFYIKIYLIKKKITIKINNLFLPNDFLNRYKLSLFKKIFFIDRYNLIQLLSVHNQTYF